MLLLFGWGKKSKEWKISQDEYLLVIWNYFHILWFPIATTRTWKIVNEKRADARVALKEEIRRLFPTDTPDISVWEKYGLLFGLAGFIILVFLDM